MLSVSFSSFVLSCFPRAIRRADFFLFFFCVVFACLNLCTCLNLNAGLLITGGIES